MTISDIMWITMSPKLRSLIDLGCKVYENDSKYTVKKYYENEELAGFYVYFDDEDGYRDITEIHYVGSNRYWLLKVWREIMKGKSKFKARVIKNNEYVLDRLIIQGFYVYKQDEANYYLKRG